MGSVTKVILLGAYKSAFKSQDDYIYKLLFYSDHDLYLDLDLKVKPDYDYGHYLVDLGLYP